MIRTNNSQAKANPWKRKQPSVPHQAASKQVRALPQEQPRTMKTLIPKQHMPAMPRRGQLPAMRRGPNAIPLNGQHLVWAWDGSAQNCLYKPSGAQLEIDYVKGEIRPPRGYSFVFMNVNVISATRATIA